jgi:hypothetical protein
MVHLLRLVLKVPLAELVLKGWPVQVLKAQLALRVCRVCKPLKAHKVYKVDKACKACKACKAYKLRKVQLELVLKAQLAHKALQEHLPV